MKRRWTLGMAAVAMALLTAWGLCAVSVEAQKAPDAGAQKAAPAVRPDVPALCGQMNVVPSAHPGFNSNLQGVSALASNDVWAVGNYGDQTLVEHWDGTSWSVVPSPNVVNAYNTLRGVSALASNDVWAVGDYSGQTLVEHWDGSIWSIVPNPNPGSAPNELYGVSALASNDVWAVGYFSNGGYDGTLVEHWDGTAWSVVPSPNVGSRTNDLYAVSALASNDVWAVGNYYDVSSNSLTLVEHWDGITWTVVPSPSPGSYDNALHGVSALATNDVWAVGNYYSGITYDRTLMEHWNGTSWSVVPSPNPAAKNDLYAVSARASNDVWAAGEDDTGVSGANQLLVEHWDGTTWSQVASPSPGPVLYWFGVSALPGGDVWVVGDYENGGSYQTLTEKYGGPCGTPTATPPPGSTATATPTVCTISFTDVHPADYFYTPVLYLACHGVISGYADGTFRPYANTTRSQMVKIVVLGFDKPITTPAGTAYSFSDVPRTNPFFPVVETAYAGGIVSGYTCGVAPAGPCDSLHRPWFLPFAYVTRGQLSKIDVIAAGWTLYNPTVPTFTDVARGSTFYEVVETAVCHGVISGYADHTFRPFNDAIRGQISKIVYLSIVNPPASCGP